MEAFFSMSSAKPWRNLKGAFMERVRKLELIQRSLGLRHKIKVYNSMDPPTTHEDLAVMLLSKWELEDELNAIENIIAGLRQDNVKEKSDLIKKGILKTKPADTKAKKKSD